LTGVERIRFYIHVCSSEAQRRRAQLLNHKWLHGNEEIAYKKIISCNKVTEFKKLGKCLYKVKCKEENDVIKTVQGLEEMIEKKLRLKKIYIYLYTHPHLYIHLTVDSN
jgi:hypothetical protein